MTKEIQHRRHKQEESRKKKYFIIIALLMAGCGGDESALEVIEQPEEIIQPEEQEHDYLSDCMASFNCTNTDGSFLDLEICRETEENCREYIANGEILFPPETDWNLLYPDSERSADRCEGRTLNFGSNGWSSPDYQIYEYRCPVCPAPERMYRYLSSLLNGKEVLRFNGRIGLVLAPGTTEGEESSVNRSMDEINKALPREFQIYISDGTDVPDNHRIDSKFLDYEGMLREQNPEIGESVAAGLARYGNPVKVFLPKKGNFKEAWGHENPNLYHVEGVIAHELLHALGLWDHPPEDMASIVSYWGVTDHRLFPLDKLGLRYLYEELAPGEIAYIDRTTVQNWLYKQPECQQ